MGNVASNNQDFDNTQVKNTFDQGIYDPELGKSLYSNDQFLAQLEPGLRPKLQADQTFQSWLNSQISAAQTAATSTATALSSDTLGKANRYTDEQTPIILGKANQYTDQQAPIILGNANKYTDQQAPIILGNANKYTDQQTPIILGNANKYTDQQASTLTQAIIDKAAAVDTNARGYSTNALTTANQYTDGKTNALNTTLTNVVNQSINPIQSYVNKTTQYMKVQDDGTSFISSIGGGLIQADADGQVQMRAKGGKNAVMYTEKNNKFVAQGDGSVYMQSVDDGNAYLVSKAQGAYISLDKDGNIVNQAAQGKYSGLFGNDAKVVVEIDGSAYAQAKSGKAAYLLANDAAVVAESDGSAFVRAKPGKASYLFANDAAVVAESDGRAFMKSKAGQPSYLFANDAMVQASAKGEAYMISSGGGLVQADTDGQVQIRSKDGKNAIMYTEKQNKWVANGAGDVYGEAAQGGYAGLFANGGNMSVDTSGGIFIKPQNDKQVVISSTLNNSAVRVDSPVNPAYTFSTKVGEEARGAVISLKSGNTDKALQLWNQTPSLTANDNAFTFFNNQAQRVASITNQGDLSINGSITSGNRVLGSTDASNNFWMGLKGSGTEDDRLAMGISGDAATGKVSQVNIRKPTTISGDTTVNGGLYIKGKSQWSFKEDANGRLCFGVNGKDAACLQTNGYLVPA